MAGVTVSGVLWAIFQNNAGGAWDNAKKSFEAGVMINGEMTHKGSPAHEAAITGDTVGDPFKDTSGPSMNILIKLTCLIGLVIAPILGESTAIHAESASEEIVNSQDFQAGPIRPSASSLIFSKTTSFTYDRENRIVSSFTFKDIVCGGEEKLCAILIKTSKNEEISFNSFPDADVKKYKSDVYTKFDKQVKGVSVIGGKKIDSKFLFSVKEENGVVSFQGMLTFFDNSSGFINNLSINVKGRQ